MKESRNLLIKKIKERINQELNDRAGLEKNIGGKSTLDPVNDFPKENGIPGSFWQVEALAKPGQEPRPFASGFIRDSIAASPLSPIRKAMRET